MGGKVEQEKATYDTNESSSNSIIKEEINLQIHWYLPLFFMIYFGSFLIPAIIFMTFIMFFYLPYFLDVSRFISIFMNLPSLLSVLTLPFIIIACYLLHLVFIAIITRWFWRFTERKSPSKAGIIPRNIPSKTLNYYHLRSFLIKYPKNAFSRGPFPWLSKWMFNFVGSNQIGKGSVIEEQVAGDRFVQVGENSYIGINAGISSHAVDGIFGNISFAEVKIGDNATAAGFNCFAPGVETGNNSWWLPMTGATKYNILKGNNFYFGTPLRKIFKKKVMEYLQITEEDLKRAEALKDSSIEKLKSNKKRE
ncbi:MAG: hypothetical protein ACFE91_00535 [Promethearchaeota archaeon]